MTRLSVLLVTLVATFVTLGACAGAQQEDANQPTAPGPSSAPVKRVSSGDVAFDLPPIEVKGVIYEPDAALGRPGMPLVQAKRQTTKEKQKALVVSTKDPVAKQAQAAIYATMLYLEDRKSVV